VPAWNYTWDLVLANPKQLVEDFKAAGRSGIHGVVEQPNAIRGSAQDVYVAPGALVHPMVVLDAAEGPIYIDEGAQIHPYTRIEGPSYIGKKTILLGAKCREGNTIGPVCRVGGEVEESIIHGYSNKYHDGFLGHAYVGEWVNLGALTTNSDLKNDYSHVEVTLEDGRPVNTGSTKVGSLIGDHTKTSIGTLLNTGANVGAMAVVNSADRLALVITPDIPALRLLHAALEVLSEMGSTADRTAFIVNDIYPKSSISADQIEEHLTIKVGMTVPYDGENFLRGINEGQPIVSLARRSAAAVALRRLAEMLADTGVQDGQAKPHKRGRLGGFLGR